MKNKISEGRILDYTVTGEAVKSGDIIVVGDLAGVAMAGGTDGQTIAVAIEGVYSVPKGTAAIPQGKKVYFVAADKTVVTTASGNTFIGYAWGNASASDTIVDVKLSF